MLSFVQMPFLLLLILVPISIITWILRERHRNQLLDRIGDRDLIRRLMGQVSPMRRRWKFGLWLIAIASLAIALARPVWGVEAEIIETQGLSVMVLLDISRSMNADDVNPSRLERAKLDLADLFKALEGHEIGLILFAGKPYVYFPPTNDINAALAFLPPITSQSTTSQGTNINLAIQLALQSFDERSLGQPIIVIVSDGDNLDGDAVAAAKDAALQGAKIYTLGYGETTGAIIPIYDAEGNLIDYQADENGNLVESKLDESLLQAVAVESGGSYRRRGQGVVTELAQLLLTQEGENLGDRVIFREIERFGIFILVAVLALSFEILLPETRKEPES